MPKVNEFVLFCIYGPGWAWAPCMIDMVRPPLWPNSEIQELCVVVVSGDCGERADLHSHGQTYFISQSRSLNLVAKQSDNTF